MVYYKASSANWTGQGGEHSDVTCRNDHTPRLEGSAFGGEAAEEGIVIGGRHGLDR